MDRYAATATATALYEALATGDRPALAALLHPEFEGHTTAGMPLGLGGTYRSADDMLRNFWGRIAKHYSAKAVPKEFHLLDDDRLSVSGSYVGTAKDSGKALDAEFVHVLGFEGGRISRLDQLTDTQAWHEALSAAARFETIDYSVRDGVAVICLNRPNERNAIDLRLGEELLEVARLCAGDSAVRAVLFQGNGPALTVGGDIRYFTESRGDSYGELFRRMTGPFHEAFRIFDRLDAPIVTAAHGSVAGGGLGFVYTADIVYAAPGTKFVTAFAAIGLSGDGGGTWHLPRLVGPRRAAQMYLENRALDADEAVEWGLITEVVAADQLRDRAYSTAAALAAGPTKAFGRMRSLLHSSWTNSLSEQFVEESEGVAYSGATEDAANAIASFVAKQRPTFEGR